MITTGFMYWLTRLDDIRDIMETISILGMFVVPIMFVLTISPILDEVEKGISIRIRMLKFVLPLLAVATALVGVGRAFVPSTKDMAAIVVVPRIANSETTKELGEGVVELAKQWIEELKPSKKEKK